ncbi:MAG: flagellar hook-basal body protein [Opitutaceae bacterium]|nr:flagellar hook-basal body protein [Opitutaceae bacterium]
MNIGIYQSASALSALERWQESVAQNITASQTIGYRKRVVNFAAEMGGEILTDRPGGRPSGDTAMQMAFPRIEQSLSFKPGETQATRRELDVAIPGEGFFEVQRDDGSRAYTRSGSFALRADRTLVTGDGAVVLTDAGAPITTVQGGGNIVINPDGTVFQGGTGLGRLSIQKFANNALLQHQPGGYFLPGNAGDPQKVEKPDLMQGYLESSNVSALREMVDLVLISRAYEANDKVIKAVDEQMGKTLEALG